MKLKFCDFMKIILKTGKMLNEIIKMKPDFPKKVFQDLLNPTYQNREKLHKQDQRQVNSILFELIFL